MYKRRKIERINSLINRVEDTRLSVLPPCLLVAPEDETVELSIEAIKLLGGDPESYPGENKKKVAIGDLRLFTPERKYKLYPDLPLSLITFI